MDMGLKPDFSKSPISRTRVLYRMRNICLASCCNHSSSSCFQEASSPSRLICLFGKNDLGLNARLNVIITVRTDSVSLKWAIVSLQIEWSELLPGHIGVYLIDILRSTVNGDGDILCSSEGECELCTGARWKCSHLTRTKYLFGSGHR